MYIFFLQVFSPYRCTKPRFDSKYQNFFNFLYSSFLFPHRCTKARFDSKYQNEIETVCEAIGFKVDAVVTERLLDPLQRNIDQVLAQAMSPGATADIKAPLAACLDQVICKVEQDTRDHKLLACVPNVYLICASTR